MEKVKDTWRISRLRNDLLSNIRGRIEILISENIYLKEMNRIEKKIIEYGNIQIFQKYQVGEIEMSDGQLKVEEIVKKPYKDWMVKKKIKVRYNFAEDAKKHGADYSTY
jgi:hypothetical protein